jgi:hypothetical protein
MKGDHPSTAADLIHSWSAVLPGSVKGQRSLEETAVQASDKAFKLTVLCRNLTLHQSPGVVTTHCIRLFVRSSLFTKHKVSSQCIVSFSLIEAGLDLLHKSAGMRSFQLLLTTPVALLNFAGSKSKISNVGQPNLHNHSWTFCQLVGAEHYLRDHIPR